MIKYKFVLFFILLIIFTLNLAACKNCKIFTFKSHKYTGDIDLVKYEVLKGKNIFLDPGHGGKADSDQCRVGPGGIKEEEVNLRVALILGDMLKRAGANVSFSRRKNADIPLRDRADMVNEMRPDLLISLHHNGSPRPMDDVNYPAVLIWGNKRVSPQNYAFAELLLDEFQRVMNVKGEVLSDFSVYTETGTMILRETRYTCPGVIGEPGFFSDEEHAKRLNDIQYNQEEAEAYFNAITRFFERGIPKAEVLISVPVNTETCLINLIKERNPIIAIKTESGLDRAGVIKESLNVTLDGIRVKCRAVADDLFFIDYGNSLYPGGHQIKFFFLNQRSQSSMIYNAAFTVEIKKGDHSRLISEGEKLLKVPAKRKEGLKMLLSALSMGLTDPDSGRVIWNIAGGFGLIGDKENSDYYYEVLYNFYPQSKYAKNCASRFKGYRFPVNYNGKSINIKYEASLVIKPKNI